MALTYYVSKDDGASGNSGSSEGSPKASGTGAATDGVTGTIDLTADSPDLSTVVVGDTIRLDSRTDGIRSTDIFEVTAVDDGADTVTVTPIPGTITSGVTWSIGGSFDTIQRAADVAEAGDTLNIKKATTEYEEHVNVLSGGFGNPTDGVVLLQGYETTVGDFGLPEWRSPTATGSCIEFPSGQVYWAIQNFWMKGHASATQGSGVRSPTGDWITCINLRCSGHGWYGIDLDNDCVCVQCYCHDNGLGEVDNIGGIKMGERAQCDFCLCVDNHWAGIRMENGICTFCLCLGNTDFGIEFTLTGVCQVFNCTVAGRNKTTDVGIQFPDNMGGRSPIVMNVILYECGTGIVGPSATSGAIVAEGVTAFGNTVNYTDFEVAVNEVLADPIFVDPGSDDYSLRDSSPSVDGVNIDTLPWVSFRGAPHYMGALPPTTSPQGAIVPPLIPWYIP